MTNILALQRLETIEDRGGCISALSILFTRA